MVDVSEIAHFTPGERTLRLVMDIAAALERYRIVMEGPSGVRRGARWQEKVVRKIALMVVGLSVGEAKGMV